MAGQSPDAPGVIASPPLLFLGTLAAGLAAHAVYPLQPLPPLYARPLGGVCLLAGVAVGRWGIATMRKAGTNVHPGRPSMVLVEDGPFRFTRNPLYIATSALYLGVTLLVDALWPIVLLPALLAVVDVGVIRREERYLERKFGETYRRYKVRVRRWI